MRVLIDGENLRHQIAHVLLSKGLITEVNNYFPFDLAGFCGAIIKDETIEISYYTTKIKQPKYAIPKALEAKISTITEANRRWVADLTNQSVRVVKAGYLRIRESSACVHCGKRTQVLQEKGVDVRVAADMIVAAQKEPALVLVSSDSDLVPAIEAAVVLGSRVTYLCYAGTLNRSVAAVAYKTVTFDDADVVQWFGKFGDRNE